MDVLGASFAFHTVQGAGVTDPLVSVRHGVPGEVPGNDIVTEEDIDTTAGWFFRYVHPVSPGMLAGGSLLASTDLSGVDAGLVQGMDIALWGWRR